MTKKKAATSLRAEAGATIGEQKPQRVELVNADKRNGRIGEVARPFEKDVAAWLGKGWQRKSAGNAE